MAPLQRIHTRWDDQPIPPVAIASSGCIQGLEGVPKIQGDANPATWVLEVSNTAVESRTGQDFADLYEASPLYKCDPSLISRPRVS